jgi:hypothetical protein
MDVILSIEYTYSGFMRSTSGLVEGIDKVILWIENQVTKFDPKELMIHTASLSCDSDKIEHFHTMEEALVLVKAEQTRKNKIQYVCWEDTYPHRCERIWLQWTGNEDTLTLISDYLKSFFTKLDGLIPHGIDVGFDKSKPDEPPVTVPVINTSIRLKHEHVSLLTTYGTWLDKVTVLRISGKLKLSGELQTILTEFSKNRRQRTGSAPYVLCTYFGLSSLFV